MILANANDLAMIINYDHNHSFIVLATVIMIINYNRKTFKVQATGLVLFQALLPRVVKACAVAWSVKAYGREPKTCLGRVFIYKLDCFDDVHVFTYVDARPHL